MGQANRLPLPFCACSAHAEGYLYQLSPNKSLMLLTVLYALIMDMHDIDSIYSVAKNDMVDI